MLDLVRTSKMYSVHQITPIPELFGFFVLLPPAKRRTMEMCLHTQLQYWIRLIAVGAGDWARDSMLEW